MKPYIEIVRYKSDGTYIYVATPHLEIGGKNDFWTPLEYRVGSGINKFNTLKQYLNRVRAYGIAWGIEVEENY